MFVNQEFKLSVVYISSNAVAAIEDKEDDGAVVEETRAVRVFDQVW